jgi:pimeloyl-ACP methyl ester carboxylesterase
MYFDYLVMPAIFLLTAVLISWLSVRRMISHSKWPCPAWRRVAERVTLSTIVVIAVPLALTSAYNAIVMQVFWATYPPPGSLYLVHGYKMHLYCTGSGSPTIVLEAGWGVSTPVLGWGSFQTGLARFTRVCSYDRAGLGWSDPQPGAADADLIAANLHELLAQAGVTGPIVLLSHSFGGIYARDYIAHYPANVEGLILLDSSTPGQQERFAAVVGPQETPHVALFVRISRLVYSAGFPRIMGMCKPLKGLDTSLARALGEDRCRTHFDAVLNEYDNFDTSSAETMHTGPFGDLPLLIISHDPAAGAGRNESIQQRSLEPLESQMQEELKRLSTHNLRIVAKGSGHGVQFDRQALVLSQVQLFIEQIRGTAPQPTNYGSTITE